MFMEKKSGWLKKKKKKAGREPRACMSAIYFPPRAAAHRGNRRGPAHAPPDRRERLGARGVTRGGFHKPTGEKCLRRAALGSGFLPRGRVGIDTLRPGVSFWGRDPPGEATSGTGPLSCRDAQGTSGGRQPPCGEHPQVRPPGAGRALVSRFPARSTREGGGGLRTQRAAPFPAPGRRLRVPHPQLCTPLEGSRATT